MAKYYTIWSRNGLQIAVRLEATNFSKNKLNFSTALEVIVGQLCNFNERSDNRKSKLGCPQLSPKRTELTILNRKDAQDSEFGSFFGRIEETINYFQDLLTFT